MVNEARLMVQGKCSVVNRRLFVVTIMCYRMIETLSMLIRTHRSVTGTGL